MADGASGADHPQHHAPARHAPAHHGSPQHHPHGSGASQGKPGNQETPESSPTREQSGAKPWVVLGAIIIIVAVFSVLLYWGIRFSKPTPLEEDYNNYHFTMDRTVPENERVWWTSVQKGNQSYNLPFMFAPWQVEDVVVPRATVEHVWRRQLNKNISVVFTIDPKSTGTAVVAGANIARIVGNKYRLFNMNVTSALTESSSIDIPIISCANATDKMIVYQLQLGNLSSISPAGAGNNCVLITAANTTDLLRLSDAYSYHLLGIMKTPA